MEAHDHCPCHDRGHNHPCSHRFGNRFDISRRWYRSGRASGRSTRHHDQRLSGASITNITGNHHTVIYDATRAAHAWLNGATYTISGGETLTPA